MMFVSHSIQISFTEIFYDCYYTVLLVYRSTFVEGDKIKFIVTAVLPKLSQSPSFIAYVFLIELLTTTLSVDSIFCSYLLSGLHFIFV